MKCYVCKKGQLKLIEYKPKMYSGTSKIKHNAKMVCDKCGHIERFN